MNVAGFTECDTATWWPVIEPDFGQERFITDDPVTLFRNGNFARVPAVLGRTADEFVDPVPSMNLFIVNCISITLFCRNFKQRRWFKKA